MVSTGLKIELFGLALVLLSTALQLFLVSPITDIASDTSGYQVEQKLDSIWIVLTDMYTNSLDHPSEVVRKANATALINDWKEWNTDVERVKRQKHLFSLMAGLVFVVGSCLVIIGKYSHAAQAEKKFNVG